MKTVTYDDLDLRSPLTTNWKVWLFRTQHTFQLLQESPSVKRAIVQWRDGTTWTIQRNHAIAFRIGIAIEGGPPNTERINMKAAGVIEHIAQGAWWIRDLNAGRSPVAR
jgi:hypothetical protein